MAGLPDRLTDDSSVPLDVLALARAYRSGAARPEEVTERLLARIAERDGAVGAYQAVYADEARRAAEAAGRALRDGFDLGPLHGVPFALKDIIDLQGRETSWGSASLAGRVAPTTGTVARRLLAAGAVLLGKTKTVEAAFGGWGTNAVLGTPRNPWDGAGHRVAGGSSSGSAAAVAAGLASFAIGSDTGGSVRVPAAFCGAVGLKTTEGLLPLDGVMPLSHSLDTLGPIARTVRDAALVFAAMRGLEATALERDTRDAAGLFAETPRGLRGVRLSRPPQAELETVEPEIAGLFAAALERCRGAGAEIVEVTQVLPNAEMSERTLRIIAVEGCAHHGERFADASRPADEHVRARILSGGEVAAVDYARTLRLRERLARDWLAGMSGVDALLTPTTPRVAPLVAEVDESLSPGVFTRPVNYLGLCALSLPMGLGAHGMPAGLQVVARPNDECTALRIGREIERLLAPSGAPDFGDR